MEDMSCASTYTKSSRMFRAITIQSKEVVALLLRGETHRCDITKSRTKYFSDADYSNCKGLAPIYIYMDSLLAESTLARKSFPRVVHAVGCEGGYSGSYSEFVIELCLDHVPPIGETHNCNKYVRVIPEIRLEDVSAIYYIDSTYASFALTVVYKTARSLFTENQRLTLAEQAEMDEAITWEIEKLRRELSIEDFYKVMGKVKLYHVAVGKHDLKRKFIPRVPESAKPPEDIITPRICFSETLEGCLSAIGHPFYYPGTPELLTVWEYEVDARYCIPQEFLYSTGLVMDASRTREWWVLHPVTLSGKYVNLVDFETTPYRIPDESKKQDLIQYVKCSAYTFTNDDMELLQKSNVHEILYKVLGNWERYRIDEEDAADYVGLDNCKTYYNCKFEEVL